MQTNVSYYQNKKAFRVLVTKSFTDLIKLKKKVIKPLLMP